MILWSLHGIYVQLRHLIKIYVNHRKYFTLSYEVLNIQFITYVVKWIIHIILDRDSDIFYLSHPGEYDSYVCYSVGIGEVYVTVRSK